MGVKKHSSSCKDGELSELEVGGFLGSFEGLEASLMLGETGSGGLGTLVSKISWGILLVLPGILGDGSSLLVNDGQDLGNSLSDNL